MIEEQWEAKHLGICTAHCVLLPGITDKKCGHRIPLKSTPLQLMPHFRAQTRVTLVLMEELTSNVNIYSKHRFGQLYARNQILGDSINSLTVSII